MAAPAVLHTNNSAVLTNLSPLAVEDAANRIKRYFGSGRWLGTNNRYRSNSFKKAEQDYASNAINSKHLAEYAAASAPLHCTDGWNYLGRAIHSHLSGDASSSRHLAYYAELRAAMSLLATQGIIVFNTRHFAVQGGGNVVGFPVKCPTHDFTWQALSGWASTSGAATLVGQVVQPFARPIDDWMSQLPLYTAWMPLAANWLKGLGLDLKTAVYDRASRNEASYRPNRILTPVEIDGRQAAKYSVTLWDALEPSAIGLGAIDTHLLRMSFEAAFRRVRKAEPAVAGNLFDQDLAVLTEFGGFTPQMSVAFENFMKRATEPEDAELIRLSREKSNFNDPLHHVHMMSRAAVLLRLATAAVSRMASNAGIGIADTEFWWAALGKDRGFWETAPLIDDLADTWADVRLALDEVDLWLAEVPPNQSMSSFASKCAEPMTKLSNFELVSLWGFAS